MAKACVVTQNMPLHRDLAYLFMQDLIGILHKQQDPNELNSVV